MVNNDLIVIHDGYQEEVLDELGPNGQLWMRDIPVPPESEPVENTNSSKMKDTMSCPLIALGKTPRVQTPQIMNSHSSI